MNGTMLEPLSNAKRGGHSAQVPGMHKQEMGGARKFNKPGSKAGAFNRPMPPKSFKQEEREKKKLKEKFHFNLNGDKMKKAMKNNLRDGVSKVIHLKKFKKAIYRKILIKKHDVTYATENFCPRNFHNSLHVQLR